MNISKAQKIIGISTALFLTLFLIAHAILCLQVLSSNSNSFNQIAQFTATHPMAKVGHVILDLLLICHIVVCIIFTIKKHKLEPQTKNPVVKKRSKIMMITGILVFIYLIIHIANFKNYNPESIGLYEYIYNLFSSGIVVFVNIFFIGMLFLHLYVAGRAMIDTFDFPEGSKKKVVLFHIILSIILFIAYSLIPLLVYLR